LRPVVHREVHLLASAVVDRRSTVGVEVRTLEAPIEQTLGPV
jgi:hypothetical protein